MEDDGDVLSETPNGWKDNSTKENGSGKKEDGKKGEGRTEGSNPRSQLPSFTTAPTVAKKNY